MRPLVIGNWKMHGSRQSVAQLLAVLREKAPEFKGVEVVVCPAYVHLAQVAEQLKGSPLAWGAQDVSQHEAGAHTGDIDAGMLKDFGCRYVLVGHSERRSAHGESSEAVAEKFRRAVAAGLVPVLCVGETLPQRVAGRALAVVEEQLNAVLQANRELKEIVVAYEPVWAIGTGKTATAEQAQEVHAFIRQQLQSRALVSRIVYGGSVNAKNAKALFIQKDIDGGLIGGASLQAENFVAICKAASQKTV
jgi:triosephosphate isomerase